MSYRDGDTTPGGSKVHVGVPQAPAPVSEQTSYIEEIEAHLERHLGPAGDVLHELFSPDIHLDVLSYPPTAGRDHWIFVTCGMSSLPMTLREGYDPTECARAELTIGLPKDWGDRLHSEPLSSADWEPVGTLKALARYVHDARTSLVWFDTIELENLRPLIQGREAFTGAIILNPITWPEAAQSLVLPTGEHLNFLGVYPLYRDELRFKLENGAAKLTDRMETQGVSEVLDTARKSVAPRKKILGIL